MAMLREGKDVIEPKIMDETVCSKSLATMRKKLIFKNLNIPYSTDRKVRLH